MIAGDKVILNGTIESTLGEEAFVQLDNNERILVWKDACIPVTDKDDPVKSRMVDHPKHYNRAGAMECIDEMVLAFGKEAVRNFCICNAWKYRYRSSDKNGQEDIEKSDWYMRKAEELT